MEQFVDPVCPAGKVQCAKQRLQSGGLGILGRGRALGDGMDMGVFAPAIVGKFVLRQRRQDLFHQFCLGGRFYQLHRIFMKPVNGVLPLGAEITAAQKFIHTVADVGKTQIGIFFRERKKY